jgi:hypothetical protein
MANYKVIVKSPGDGSPASPSNVSIIGPDGKPVELVQSIRFSAKVGGYPSLEITTLVKDFELEVCEENVSLLTDSGKREDFVPKSEYLKEIEAQGGYMSKEAFFKKLNIVV